MGLIVGADRSPRIRFPCMVMHPETFFTPAEIDGLTLEGVAFQRSKDGKRIVMADVPERIFRMAVDNNWVLTELRQDGATLEDVFAELTR